MNKYCINIIKKSAVITVFRVGSGVSEIIIVYSILIFLLILRIKKEVNKGWKNKMDLKFW